MRLINTKTLQLTEIFEKDAKPYAILSHTWGEEEVSFQEMQSGRPDTSKEGYRKIADSCRQAAMDGYEFNWVDTCCIDKSSSAELSESINSMYNWYRKAAACYVYLADVRLLVDANVDHAESAFRHSRWFTRGWTLQELIAPANVSFFTGDWKFFGTKTELKLILAKDTGIHEAALSTSSMKNFSIAQKMSWASKRITTRPEDIAYCLMGMFDVNMPLLYGEGGEKAFIRLQEQLLQSSDDQSLFAWGPVDQVRYPTYYATYYDIQKIEKEGLLAKSPAKFADLGP